MNRSLVALLVIMAVVVFPHPPRCASAMAYTPVFDGTEAYDHLLAQCAIGPRPPGSTNLSVCRDYIKNSLLQEGWSVSLQNFTYLGVNCSNVIARWSDDTVPNYILGAHYDTRPHADSDPGAQNRTKPVLGANDGASGTAVLLELASSLPELVRPAVEFVFFDAEDSGYINGWSWIVGSTHYVSMLSPSRIANTTAMLLVDMVGDASLRLLRETSSTRSLQDAVWATARDLGYASVFIDSRGGGIHDDHRPFLDAGIPALDIIQHAPFPWYWHTLEDTPDKCSSQSLEAVGTVLESFLVDAHTSSPTFSGNPPDLFPVVLLVVPLLVLVVFFLRSRQK
ncbi:MAG: M28 family peptidase [Candidatus Thorarchaeota archaeon]|nr:M28 family peptidase [Candidatus Thorarchaeota archaeon]